MIFSLFSAKTVDAYLGLGMGGAGLKRSFLTMKTNGNNKEKIIKPETTWAHSFAIRMVFGATYHFYQNYFTGLEGYLGHQFLENVFLKAGFFGGTRALVGMSLPYEMKVQLSLGVDIGRHVSKKVGNELTYAEHNQNDICPPFVEYDHVAPCMNLAWTQNNGNLSVRVEIEMIFPKTTTTPKSVCYTSLLEEPLGEPLYPSKTTGGEINYRATQWRLGFSIIFHQSLPLTFLKS